MKSFSKFSIFYNKHGLRHGFSLVEMLMALLVASLLLAALAPVMTKRMNEKVNFEGVVENPVRHKIVYLTEPGNGEWEVPNGIRQYKVTAVGAGGGGGAGSNYGCVVFTTTATPTGSLLSNDAEYCEHVRTDGNANFTIPDGIDEIYVSLISGAGGGGAGSAKWGNTITYDKAGTYTWNVPEYLRGDRILVTMNGGGGGGGGGDQGAGGGGASGGYVAPAVYDIASNKSSIQAIVGGGGGGGYYYGTPGKGGHNGGESGVASTSGGGGGGASNFDNGKITAFGGGGGAGSPGPTQGLAYAGWTALNVWKNVFNYGGNGRNGGTSGPYTANGRTYGGASGGNGAAGGGVTTGGNGINGSVGENGTAMGSARGGGGGAQGASGSGKGGYGQDQQENRAAAGADVTNLTKGGAGGGGGGSYFAAGASAPSGCSYYVTNGGSSVTIAKAGTGAGGAGASCGYQNGGTHYGGGGGDGIIKINYLAMNYGGTGGQSGAVIPRSRIALTNTMKSGNTLTITLGRGGKGGDRVIAHPNGNNIEIRTINNSGAVNSTTNLDNAKGAFGTASSIVFNGTNIATTGTGSCGGGYQTSEAALVNCQNSNCGTRQLNGSCNTVTAGGHGWHGHQSGACVTNEPDSSKPRHFAGRVTYGGWPTMLEWDGINHCVAETRGILSYRNGLDGSVARGGGGSYYGGYGGKGGDGYVKIEWGIPRNIDRTEAERYAGGGGAAGETITRYITVSPITRKIKYTIGTGGAGGNFDSNALKMTDGVDGGNTVFGNGGSYGFDTITAKGGKGGKSVKITSTYDSYFSITSLIGTNGTGGIACTDANKCSISLNGKSGNNNIGGDGGNSNTGIGGKGGSDTNINGLNALEFDGKTGGGAGGGGGASGNNSYGKGGKGANGYIKIEYDD